MILPSMVSASLGKYDLTDRNEEGSVNFSVAQIIIHPDWDFETFKYDADLAVVVLKEKVEFSDSI